VSKKTKRKDGQRTQHAMAAKIDKIQKFEDWEEAILPKIQQMMKDGKSSKEIIEFGKSLAAARTVKEILNPDASKALAASKDVLDRADGKAKETRETIHKFGELPEKELDALIESGLQEITDDESETSSH
jgi:hypothetical protein